MEGEATNCDNNISYGYWFRFLLLHFESSSLAVPGEKQQRMAKVLRHLPLTYVGDSDEAPGFG